MLKIKKSILYTLFLGLALNIVSVGAMSQKNAQEATGTLWTRVGSLFAVAGIGVLTIYALRYIDHLKENALSAIKKMGDEAMNELFDRTPLEVKNAGLLQAIKEESLDDVKLCIRGGADVNTVDETHTPALANALGNLPIFTYLIAQPTLNINLITEDDDGDSHSVLMHILMSCEQPSEESFKQIIKLVLAHPQLVIDLKDNHNQTALLYAADDAPASVVRLLLDKGANPNLAGFRGMTALMAAAESADIEKVKLLLEFGARPETATEDNDDDDVKNKTVLELIRNIFIPIGRGKLAGRISLIDRVTAFEKIGKYQEIYKYIYNFMLRDITSRNARQQQVEQILAPVVDDAAWIVNQYLQNEDPSVDVG